MPQLKQFGYRLLESFHCVLITASVTEQFDCMDDTNRQSQMNYICSDVRHI